MRINLYFCEIIITYKDKLKLIDKLLIISFLLLLFVIILIIKFPVK